MTIDKLKFWLPYGGGFMVIPGEESYLDGDFFKNGWMFFLFWAWHLSWVALPFYLVQYLP